MRVPVPPCFSLTRSPSQGRHKDRSSAPCACWSFSHHPRALQPGQDRDQLVPPCPGWVQSPAARCDAGSSQQELRQVPNPPRSPLQLPRDGACTLLSGGFQPQHTQVAPSSTHPHHSIPRQPRSHPAALPHQAKPPRAARGAEGCWDRLPAPSSLPRQPLGLSALFRASHKQTAKISEVTWHHQSAHGVSLRAFPSPPASPSAPATPMCCIQP